MIRVVSRILCICMNIGPIVPRMHLAHHPSVVRDVDRRTDVIIHEKDVSPFCLFRFVPSSHHCFRHIRNSSTQHKDRPSTMTRAVFLLLVLLIDSSHAFAVFPQTGRLSETSLHIFGGFGDAFKNDDKLAPRKNEGLTGVSFTL